MDESAHEEELNENEEFAHDEFDPDRFYKALSNALVQLHDLDTSEAA
jgi:hypothetical protein